MKGWVVAGERKGERAQRVEGRGTQEVECEGKQEVRSQVRGGDNDKLCSFFSPVRSDRNGEKGNDEQQKRPEVILVFKT